MLPRASLLGSLLVAVTLLVNQTQLTSGLAVMSVDLGSEWIKVAVVKPGIPMEIVLNKESQRKTAVSIALREDELLYGDPAMSVGVRYPKSNYYYLQDLLAKPLDNPLVKLHQERFPFYNLAQDEERGTMYFQHSDDLMFHPEELLAIALNKSMQAAENFAEQMIKDAVITVPAYFNQAERRAVLYAAELAGLRVLQLMNDNAAVALNYGAFRRTDFNATPHTILFYDMGAGSTTATIVSYQLVKTKEKGVQETNPQLTIKGVGFDRTLGGLEWEVRLQQHLADLFDQQGLTPTKVRTSHRAMAKLLKEAKRVKKVLSANTDITSQIEGLLDDKDFRAHVTRAQLEGMTEDLFERVAGPIDRALRSSEMTMDEIHQVILVGGGTRIPKVQETLLKVTGKKELGKSINADEAAALGAVYHAAHLSKGFKVKKFLIKDANVFPIQVEFERDLVDDDGREVTRGVKRTLFGVSNPFPQKKVMTFNKHFEDFSFRVNYGDLERVMRQEDLDAFGSRRLVEVKLEGVRRAIEKNLGSDNKGIKAHFRVDESGLFHLDGVESVFETTQNVTEDTTQEEQSTLAKLGKTISSFFSGGSTNEEDEDTKMETEEEGEQKEGEEGGEEEEGEGVGEGEGGGDGEAEKGETQQDDKEQDEKVEKSEKEEEEKEEETGDQATEAESEQTQEQEEAEADGKEAEDAGKEAEDAGKTDDQAESDGDEKTQEGDKDKTEEEEKGEKKSEESKEDAAKEEVKKETKPKIVTKKENITMNVEVLDLNEPTRDSRKASRAKLRELKKKEEQRIEREKALNGLEAFIFDYQDRLYDQDYEACTTEEERDDVRTKLSEASDWLYDQEPDVAASAYKDKLKALKKVIKDVDFRVDQLRRRPAIIESAKSALNASYHFMIAAKNVTGEDLLYTETEFGLLEKAFNDTNLWFTTKLEEQEKTALTEKPVLLVSELEDKLLSLEREVRYLVGKAKSAPPKPKKKKEKVEKKKKKKTTNSTESEDGDKAEEEEEEKVILPPPDEQTEDAEDTPTEQPEVLELGGGEDQSEDSPTEATPTEEEPEEPLQLEAPAKETSDSIGEDTAAKDETQPEQESSKSYAEHSHKNGDL